jgi:trigger factor
LLKVDVEATAVDAAYETVTSEFQRGVKLPGFRPGKVPRDIITKNFSRDLESEVRRRIINDSYKKALADHKLHVVGAPEIKEGVFSKSQNFTFDITVETAPEFELPEYKGLPAKKEARSVTDEDVQRAFDVLRQRGATFNDVDRPAQTGDIVVVNYTGTSDERPLTDFAPTARGLTEQQNFWMEIKEGSFVPGFTEQLAGATKGEKRTINVTFPQEFVSEQLAGRNAVYQVEVVQVKEKVLPELNDGFAVQWGAENLEKMRQNIRKDLEMELATKQRRSVRSQLVEGLSGRVQCELPESLVAGETRNAVYEIVADNQQRGVSKEVIDEKRDEIYSYANNGAKEKLKIAFLLGRIAEKEKVQVTREEILGRIYQIAQERQVKPDKLIKDLQKNNGINQIHEQILFGKVVDLLEQHAQIEEVPPQAETSGESNAS